MRVKVPDGRAICTTTGPQPIEHVRVAIADCIIFLLHFVVLTLKTLKINCVNDASSITSLDSKCSEPQKYKTLYDG